MSNPQLQFLKRPFHQRKRAFQLLVLDSKLYMFYIGNKLLRSNNLTPRHPSSPLLFHSPFFKFFSILLIPNLSHHEKDSLQALFLFPNGFALCRNGIKQFKLEN